jgi:hypothetical protein
MPTTPPTCPWDGRPLGVLPPSAPHKRFCSQACRQAYHRARAREAREALRQREGQAQEAADFPSTKAKAPTT